MNSIELAGISAGLGALHTVKRLRRIEEINIKAAMKKAKDIGNKKFYFQSPISSTKPVKLDNKQELARLRKMKQDKMEPKAIPLRRGSGSLSRNFVHATT